MRETTAQVTLLFTAEQHRRLKEASAMTGLDVHRSLQQWCVCYAQALVDGTEVLYIVRETEGMQ